ncbi:hypothetical protein L1049_025385 [Liquidambar formosana]|uniref:Uncharacterized protein n=1 Tax=Liquidambar formosana TaxID=63359 RepID=A0AAP0NCS1_LIQFO
MRISYSPKYGDYPPFKELRKLVRKVHSIQEQQDIAEENEGVVDAAQIRARKSLTRFLRDIAKQMPTE